MLGEPWLTRGYSTVAPNVLTTPANRQLCSHEYCTYCLDVVHSLRLNVMYLELVLRLSILKHLDQGVHTLIGWSRDPVLFALAYNQTV